MSNRLAKWWDRRRSSPMLDPSSVATITVPAAWDEIERGVEVPGVRVVWHSNSVLRFANPVRVFTEDAPTPGDLQRLRIGTLSFAVHRVESSTMLSSTITARSLHTR